MKRLLFLMLWFALSLSYAQNLTIGTTSQNPPFNSLADQKDHFYGFDIDIMGEICNRIQARCQFIPLLFNSLFTQLSTENIDLAIAAIVITPYRQQEFLFSLPYLESRGQFITLQQSNINTLENIPNKKIGTRLGTPFKELAFSLYKNSVTLVDVLDIADLMDSLNNKTIDVALMDAEAAKNWVMNNSNVYKLIGAPIPVGGGYGIMANPNQGALISQINQALLHMEDDGTYLKIYTRYFPD